MNFHQHQALLPPNDRSWLRFHHNCWHCVPSNYSVG